MVMCVVFTQKQKQYYQINAFVHHYIRYHIQFSEEKFPNLRMEQYFPKTLYFLKTFYLSNYLNMYLSIMPLKGINIKYK